MKPETKLKMKLFKALKQIPHCWFVKVQQRTIRGTPDVIICCRGKFFARELKSVETKYGVDPLQAHTLEQIKNAGGDADVLDENNIDQFIVDLYHLGAKYGRKRKQNW